MIIVCLTTFGFVASGASAQTCYRIIDLGEIGATTAAAGPFGINNAGLAVFTKEVSGKKHAFVNVDSSSLNPLGAGNFDLHDLSDLDVDGESVAHDVNDSDIAVGWATFAGKKHAVVWRIDLYDEFATPKIPRLDLGLLTVDSTFSEAFAINDDGEPIIVGVADKRVNCVCDETPNSLTSLGFWVALTDPEPDLATDADVLLHDNSNSCLPTTASYDINTDIGPGNTTAVGASFDGTMLCPGFGVIVGTYWDNPNAVGKDLNDSSFFVWDAMGISDIGAIVGTADGVAQYWDDGMADPLNIGSKVSNPSFAQRINNNDPASGVLAVVGSRGIIDSEQAVLWECSGDCTTLANWSGLILEENLIPDCSGWDMRRADDVNDDGMIICWATGLGTQRAVILEPDELCCPADLDGNGTVGTSDLLILLANWGPCPAPPVACFADLDCDGSVGTSDQLILFANWGPCGEAGGGGGSTSLESAVQQLGFPSVAAHQAWLAQAGDGEAYASTIVLITILQDQDDE